MDAKELGAQRAYVHQGQVGTSSPPRYQLGLTKRELFAAMAMQSAIALENAAPCTDTYSAIATRCVLIADALLAELAKEQP